MTLHHKHKPLIGAALAALLLLASANNVSAHQPYFEEEDWSADAPYTVVDPTVSTALYATLESGSDVDYVTFRGAAGTRVAVGLTIPQIDGQDDFAPTLALLGPGLPGVVLPGRVATPAEDTGGVIVAPPTGPARAFFEPFSRTRYWTRQETNITLPEDGDYTVAVWHPQGAVGRYTLVVGNREIPGGDVAFPFKLRAFWTPVPQPPVATEPTPTPLPPRRYSCGGQYR